MSEVQVIERSRLACGNIVMDIGACFSESPAEEGTEVNQLDAPVRININISNVTRPSQSERGTNFCFDFVLAQFLPPTNDAKRIITSCLTSGIRNPHPSLLDLFQTAIIEFAFEAAVKSWDNRKHGFTLIVIMIIFLTPEVLEEAIEEFDGLFLLDNLGEVEEEEEEEEEIGGEESADPKMATLISELQSLEFREKGGIDDAKECSICLIEYEAGVNLKKVWCSHVFHEHCLLRWLERADTCPLCRATIIARENVNDEDEER